MPKPKKVAVMLDLEWPYKRHVGILSGAHRYSVEQGWRLIVDEYADELLRARTANPIPYDGIIARVKRTLGSKIAFLKVPVVNVMASSPMWNLLPGVFPDYVTSGRLRAEHLLSRGLRQFCALTARGDRADILEMQGFTSTLKDAGFSCHSITISQNPTSTLKDWRKTQKTISEWMEAWKLPIGVFIASESDGRIVTQMCANHSWRVPDDVAIIAGRNEETLCEGFHPTLSSVEMGYERIGYEAARLLDQLMNGKVPPKKPVLLPPQGIVARESTDFYAVDDKLITAALRYIAEKSHLKIGQDDVAEAVATETRTLQRRFKKLLKRPIVAEIRRVRIERAKRALVQSEHSLAEIAHDVGFGESMRMYEVFKRELGVTPSQYRRERQGAKSD